MEIKRGKHVTITIDLKPGDVVNTNFWGSEMNGRDFVIETIDYNDISQSGFMVKLKGRERRLDSDWLIKKEDNG